MNNQTYLKIEQFNNSLTNKSNLLIKDWIPLLYNQNDSAVSWVTNLIESLPIDLRLINQQLTNLTIIIPGDIFLKLKKELTQIYGFEPGKTQEDGFLQVDGIFIGFDLAE